MLVEKPSKEMSLWSWHKGNRPNGAQSEVISKELYQVNSGRSKNTALNVTEQINGSRQSLIMIADWVWEYKQEEINVMLCLGSQTNVHRELYQYEIQQLESRDSYSSVCQIKVFMEHSITAIHAPNSWKWNRTYLQ